ncbi:alpha-tubulin N-acetyltransferase-like isoform X2 [Chironomus tepperi]|uniref:alpha-tubulin N-acetyltransferase-like isoform X2 n=1 Tax=Chironomus tepperi TaxID=113505 RepID=UPI00391F4CAF
MEFRFNINKIFKNNISRIGNSLLPAAFVAPDRRSALDATAYVAEIINTIGQASAAAQGLNQAVTTADRLRNCDEQVVYLMTEDNGKNGLVVGLLKIGRKSLYVFDKFGDTKHLLAPCVLDFYIHETRQRAGLGKVLFEYMLEYENLLPEQLAIDRPSEKLLSFLKKHYALTEKIPQMNNFVIYDGFFSVQDSQRDEMKASNMHITASQQDNINIIKAHDTNIHNEGQLENAENNDKLSQEMQMLELEKNDSNLETSAMLESKNDNDINEDHDDTEYFEKQTNFFDDSEQFHHQQQHFRNHQNLQIPERQQQCTSPTSFQYNKRQTGKKNVSHIVVGTDDKIEFDQVDDKGFGVVKINRPIGVSSRSSTHEQLNDNESIHSHDSERTHTADGYFDLKFYSHRLW